MAVILRPLISSESGIVSVFVVHEMSNSAKVGQEKFGDGAYSKINK